MMKEQGLEWVMKVQGSGEEMEEEGLGSVAASTHMGGEVMKGADTMSRVVLVTSYITQSCDSSSSHHLYRTTYIIPFNSLSNSLVLSI
jgi:hypothetical protein